MTDKTKRILLIYNPAAGQRHRARFQGVRRRLAVLGCEVVERETRAPGDAARFAREAARSEKIRAATDAVVAAGGDGTINEVIAGLDGCDLPLGLLPLGTANVLAAEIGLDLQPDRLAKTIAAGSPRPVHLGLANGHPFAVMAGVGLDARVVERANLGLKHWTGKFAYIWQTLVELVRLSPCRYLVTVEDRPYDVAAAIVANGRFYGGRFVCAPDARIDTPELHAVLFRRSGRVNALRYMWGLATGRLSRFPDVHILRATKLSIIGQPGEPVQGDGDIIARLPVEISLAARTLPLLWPD